MRVLHLFHPLDQITLVALDKGRAMATLDRNKRKTPLPVNPEEGKDQAAAEMGRKGGKARAERMTPERRAEIARKAAAKRWGNKAPI